MEIVTYHQKHEEQVVELWNRALWADPVTVQKFRNQALFDDNFDPGLCDIALEGGQIVGFILATRRKFPYMERGLEPDRGWINVFVVDPPFRRRGIGTALLDGAEKKLAALGAREITYGAYSPNYFFPGVDGESYPEAPPFLERSRWRAGEKAYSMKKDLQGYRPSQKALEKKAAAEQQGYRFINFDYSYALELLEFARAEFGGGWKRNALVSMQKGLAEDCILLALNARSGIAGFCMRMIDGNPMRFGPIGVASSERNAGLGGILFDMMQMEMTRRGIFHLFFLSTDEPGRRFYERHGVSVFRTFMDYRKEPA
jgi:ribosomal protein S18 acetylase RimI-like enzyme